MYLSVYHSIHLSIYLFCFLSSYHRFYVTLPLSPSLCALQMHINILVSCMCILCIYLFLFIHSFIFVYLFIYLFVYLFIIIIIIIIITSLCYLSFSIRKLSCCADQTMFLAESCDANESAVFFCDCSLRLLLSTLLCRSKTVMVDELNADIDRLNASIISLGEDADVTDVTDVCWNEMKHLIF